MKLPAMYGRPGQGIASVEATPGSIRSILDELDAQFPGLRVKFLDEDGGLRRHIAIFVNGSDIRYEGGLDKEVGERDEMLIVPTIAGGDY